MGEAEENVGDGGVVENSGDDVGNKVVVGLGMPPFLWRGGGIVRRGGKAGEAACASAFARGHGNWGGSSITISEIQSDDVDEERERDKMDWQSVLV
jgi:hypothetical protein